MKVVDTHPDTTHTLRIDQPFPALEQYARQLDLDSMDSMEHSHVPWVVLLVKALLRWKDAVSQPGFLLPSLSKLMSSAVANFLGQISMMMTIQTGRTPSKRHFGR